LSTLIDQKQPVKYTKSDFYGRSEFRRYFGSASANCNTFDDGIAYYTWRPLKEEN
jgi:hypothetical protein